jgi:hypothetical protein
LEVEEFGEAFVAGLFDEGGEGGFDVAGVAADEGDGQERVLRVVEVIDFGHGDVVVVMPFIFETFDHAAFVLEVEGVGDFEIELEDTDEHGTNFQFPVSSFQTRKLISGNWKLGTENCG